MKLNTEKPERKKYYFLLLFIVAYCIIMLYFNVFDKDTRRIDVDGDGEIETVVEYELLDGKIRYVIEQNGTIYKTVYDRDGKIAGKWKQVPIPGIDDAYTIYVWDEGTEEWLIDQNMNRIPDEIENLNPGHSM